MGFEGTASQWMMIGPLLMQKMNSFLSREQGKVINYTIIIKKPHQCLSDWLIVPVVVVYTKCEAVEVKAIMALEEQGESYESATQKAPKYTEELLKNIHQQLQALKYPPQGHVYLQGGWFQWTVAS